MISFLQKKISLTQECDGPSFSLISIFFLLLMSMSCWEMCIGLVPKIQFIISNVSAVTFLPFPQERSEVPMVCVSCQYSSCLVHLIGVLQTDDEIVLLVNNIIRCSCSHRSWGPKRLFNHLFWLLPLILILFQVLTRKAYIPFSRFCEIRLQFKYVSLIGMLFLSTGLLFIQSLLYPIS